MAAWGIAAIVALLVAVRLLIGCGAEPSPPVRIGPAASGARPGPGTGSAARPMLYVHVAGAVRHPGVYRVPDGGRVASAVRRAGGPRAGADTNGVNLAAPLEDGQQVVVPSSAEASGGTPGSEAPISLGSATVEQLDELDGIGPTLAERIVEHRQASGGFGSLDQLGEVEGIGEKRLEALREALTP